MKHNWVGLMSDINTPHWATRYWWECSNCHEETEYKDNYNQENRPSENGCKAKEKGSIYPLSSI